jgi:hypothetical protein
MQVMVVMAERHRMILHLVQGFTVMFSPAKNVTKNLRRKLIMNCETHLCFFVLAFCFFQTQKKNMAVEKFVFPVIVFRVCN